METSSQKSFAAAPERRLPSLRFVRATAAAALALVLCACQTAPAPEVKAAEPSPAVAREKTLSALGFMEDGDAWTLSLDAPLSFDRDSAELTAGAREAVAKVARGLMAAGLDNVRVEGHTDNTGNRNYNVELSRRRAAHVAELMVAAGFPSSGIEQRAFAYDYPLASNATADGRARNRRVTVTVVLPETGK